MYLTSSTQPQCPFIHSDKGSKKLILSINFTHSHVESVLCSLFNLGVTSSFILNSSFILSYNINTPFTCRWYIASSLFSLWVASSLLLEARLTLEHNPSLELMIAPRFVLAPCVNLLPLRVPFVLNQIPLLLFMSCCNWCSAMLAFCTTQKDCGSAEIQQFAGYCDVKHTWIFYFSSYSSTLVISIDFSISCNTHQ